MTTVNASDPAVSLLSLLALIRRGESVLVTEGGATVATLVPTEADEESRPWRGVFADISTASGIGSLPPEPALPERRVAGPNLSWLPDREGDDE